MNESSNNVLIERLNSQIASGNYEQIYSELSESAKISTPKEEFLERINKAVKMMKEADDSLTFKEDKRFVFQMKCPIFILCTEKLKIIVKSLILKSQ